MTSRPHLRGHTALCDASAHQLLDFFATELLGGRRVLHRHVATEEDAHELVLRGIPAEALTKLFAAVLSLSSNVLLATIGISERSFARRKAAPKTRLAVDESERLWRFVAESWAASLRTRAT